MLLQLTDRPPADDAGRSGVFGRSAGAAGAYAKRSDKDERRRGENKPASSSVAVFDAEATRSASSSRSRASWGPHGWCLSWWIGPDQARQDELHPLITVGIVAVFLKIDPFQDGNGRLSRGLTTLLLLRPGDAYFPFSLLDSIIEQRERTVTIWPCDGPRGLFPPTRQISRPG